MAPSLLKLNGSEVSIEDSGKTVVNINICQESSLSYLVKAVAAAGRKWPGQKAPAPPKTLEPSAPAATSPARAQCTGEQKVLGAVQILLGIMCLGLGGVLCFFNEFMPAIVSGAPFWMGSLFVVSGSLCVLSERRRSCCSALLATFFNLVSVVAGGVGLACGVAYVPYLGYAPYWVDSLCNGEEDYQPVRPTWSPDSDKRVQQCEARMMSLLNILNGVQILLLISSVAALGIALFCFGYGLRLLCCSLRANSEDYVAIGDMEVPLPYEEPPKGDSAA